MSNWLAAIVQVSGGFFHDLVMFRKARKMSLVAASSLGKCPRFFNTLRSCICKLSMAGGVDDLSHLRRITVKGDDLLPISAPAENLQENALRIGDYLSAIIGYFLPQGPDSNSLSRLAAGSAVSAR